VIAESLGWPSAHALARQLEDLLPSTPKRREAAVDSPPTRPLDPGAQWRITTASG
jgi:hypothetical protein